LPKPAVVPSNDKKKKKVEPSVPVVVDKESVAFQRGKRSCTVSDLKNFKPESILNQLNEAAEGKKSVVKPVKAAGPSLLQQA